MQWKQLLEADRHDVWCTASTRQEIGNVESWRKPVDQVLRKAFEALQIGVVGRDLHEETDVRHLTSVTNDRAQLIHYFTSHSAASAGLETPRSLRFPVPSSYTQPWIQTSFPSSLALLIAAVLLKFSTCLTTFASTTIGRASATGFDATPSD